LAIGRERGISQSSEQGRVTQTSGSKDKKVAAVQAEIARERAESLARGAQRLRTTLSTLRDADAGTAPAKGKDRAQLLAEASEACLAYLVQREIMGLGAQDAQAVRKEFQVPPDVWNSMGALRRS
jgi:hypothetical protein